jgi:hypothetical protein
VTTASAARVQSTPSPAEKPRPEKTYVVADLPAIVLTPSQVAGWPTATRTDLTGPFTPTTNTSSQENPQPVASARAGYRQTIANPGGPGVNTVRTILELFDNASSAQAASSTTVRAYEKLGYTQRIDIAALQLAPDAVARSGTNVPIAPQSEKGSAKQATVFVWRSGNLLLIQVVAGDSGVTLAGSVKWAQFAGTNAKAHGSVAGA